MQQIEETRRDEIPDCSGVYVRGGEHQKDLVLFFIFWQQWSQIKAASSLFLNNGPQKGVSVCFLFVSQASAVKY